MKTSGKIPMSSLVGRIQWLWLESRISISPKWETGSKSILNLLYKTKWSLQRPRKTCFLLMSSKSWTSLSSMVTMTTLTTWRLFLLPCWMCWMASLIFLLLKYPLWRVSCYCVRRIPESVEGSHNGYCHRTVSKVKQIVYTLYLLLWWW